MSVSAASADDGTYAPEVLCELTPEHRGRLELIWADGKYNNRGLDRWLAKAKVGYRVEVIGRPPGSVGFVKLPRRWVVERTFAWIGRYRRNSRDYEWYTSSSESMIRISSIHRMLRTLNTDKSKKPIPFKYRELQARLMMDCGVVPRSGLRSLQSARSVGLLIGSTCSLVRHPRR